MISVFRGCKLRFERFWISKQLEFLWVYCIHKCAKSTQIFRHQLSHIRPVIHAFYFQFWFFIHEVSCVRITLPLPENPAKFEWTWLIFCAVLHKLYTTICLWKDPMLWKTSADGFCSSAFLIDDSSWSWVWSFFKAQSKEISSDNVRKKQAFAFEVRRWADPLFGIALISVCCKRIWRCIQEDVLHVKPKICSTK